MCGRHLRMRPRSYEFIVKYRRFRNENTHNPLYLGASGTDFVRFSGAVCRRCFPAEVSGRNLLYLQVPDPSGRGGSRLRQRGGDRPSCGEDEELPDLLEERREGGHTVHPREQDGENRFQQHGQHNVRLSLRQRVRRLGGLPALVRHILVLLAPSFLHVNLLGSQSLVLRRMVLAVAL